MVSVCACVCVCVCVSGMIQGRDPDGDFQQVFLNRSPKNESKGRIQKARNRSEQVRSVQQVNYPHRHESKRQTGNVRRILDQERQTQ